MKLLFDIETDGLLDTLSTIHCLVIQEIETGKIHSLHGADIPQGIKMLAAADEIIGHNIIKFDIPAIQKLYSSFQPPQKIIDTLVLARLFWPQLDETDPGLVKRGKLPKKLIGRYSLEAFGMRLGVWKGDYAAEMKARGLDPWGSWSQQMQDYCVQDVKVNHRLYERALRVWAGYDRPHQKLRDEYLSRRQHPDKVPLHPFSSSSIWLEMRVAQILYAQEQWGFAFDKKAAEELYLTLLDERENIKQHLKDIFPSWYMADGDVIIPKRSRKLQATGATYTQGEPYQKIKLAEFNPASTHHITSRLKALYGWQPQEFTPSGQPKCDESVLSKLPYREAQALTRYLLVNKRIGQVAEGSQSWLKREKGGRIHGQVTTLGAITRRMTHQSPNMAQVPSNSAPFGKQCRALFTASKGYVLVGCDADALELRCLAGYMAAYDNGAYIETIEKGDKAKGTDMHSVNARALGLDPHQNYPVDGKQVNGRDLAKVWFYAFLYGAGDEKLGATLGATGIKKQVITKGKQARAAFLDALPAFKTLTEHVRKKAMRGYLMGLDGGKLYVRSPHAALNTLLQSAGAIIMKQALVILDDGLRSHGLKPNDDYGFCANIHDEFQIDAKVQYGELVKSLAEQSIAKAGKVLKFACPLKGHGVIGNCWRDTH